jgi:F420-dependent methylenetetrahydromethanopterin dehydrogenase
MKALLTLLLLAGPAAAQQVASDSAGEPGVATDVAPGVAPAADPLAEAADPVARWQAAPETVLEGPEVDLEAFEYVARPFVIFADSPRQPQLAEQLRLLEADPGALARLDVAVIVDSDPEAASEVRRGLRPRGFGVVLVDKDGRVALRRPAPLTVREIVRAIDRSPIRQEELRAGGREAE